LIKPGLNTAVPLFTEVLIRQLVVVLQNHCLCWLNFKNVGSE
jgi:hypothetical protein